MPKMQCIVVTPERTVVDAGADFVALPLYDGELGVAENHSALLGRLGSGELRISDEGLTQRYYVEGGFVEVKDNVVLLLTQRAMPAQSLSLAAAMEQLEAARNRPAGTPELMAIRERAVAQARAQLHVAERAAF